MLRTIKTLAAALFVVAFGAVALGVEPPQCNLPGWGVATVTQTVTTYRSPVGHTHTCVNGHTWDHSVTAGHNCPICGAFQNVQDRSPRMVTVTVQTKVAEPPAPRTVAAPAFVLPQAASPCANGQCSTVQRRFR